MSSKIHNFYTHFDDHKTIGNSFDHHVVPGYSYSPKHSQQHLQRSKMPGLLRLDSVGEVSSSRLPSDSQTYSSKPLLRNCKSTDLDNSYKTPRFFSKSNSMTSAKSLTRSHNTTGSQPMSAPVFTKSHSFAEESQLGSTTYSFGKVAAPNSFEFNKNSVFNKMFSVFSPRRMTDYSTLYRSRWQQEWSDVDPTLLKTMDKHILGTNTKHEEKPTSMLSVAAAACFQPASSKVVPAESQHFLVSDKNDSISNIVNVSKLTGAEVNDQNSRENVETLELMSPSNTTNRGVSDQSDSSVIFDENFAEETCFPIVDLSLKSDLLQKALDDGKQRGKRSRNCGALKSDSDKNSGFDDIMHSSYKSVVEPSTVLSTPRKTAKKGRPSSKKQKKRQREKRKHHSSHSVFPGFPSSSYSTSNVDEEQYVSACDNKISVQEESVSPASIKTANSLLCNSIPRKLSQGQTQSKCLIANFFFTPDLEETDDDVDSDASSEWSVSEDESSVCVSAIKCSAFNVALNLDMIFKQKSIPSLKSVLWAEEIEPELETPSQSAKDKHTQNVTHCTSNGNSCSRDSSCGVCVPLATAALATIGLSNGLSLDSLFTEKPSLCTSAETKVVDDAAFDVVDSPSTNDVDATHHLSGSLEAISRINAKWDEYYPTAGFRTCQGNSADEITDSSIKVHFAKGTKLKTVHIVGTEDRAGTWQHYVLDRERFQRRILDLEKVISPVLAASHRAKVLKRNQ